MEIKNLLILVLLFLIVPVWIGTIWAELVKIDRKLKYLCFCWVSGFFTMLAFAQVSAVPLILCRKRFEVFQNFYTMLLVMLCILAAVFLFQRKKQGRKVQFQTLKRPAWTALLFAAGAAGLIGIQTYFVSAYQHLDDDDSRFIAEEVMAVEDGTMYTHNPINGKISYWDMGEVKKDMTSPWTMFVAYISDACNIAPAVLSHKYLPIFLIPMCYAVYAMIGMYFFKDDLEKTSIFLIFASALHMYGYSSTHTVSAVMLLRIWQGKAVVGSLCIPFAFYVLCELQEQKAKRGWYGISAVSSCAAALASGSGITAIPIVIGIGGLVNLIHKGGFSKTVKIWCTAIPSVVFLFCYLFFWQLLKIYF